MANGLPLAVKVPHKQSLSTQELVVASDKSPRASPSGFFTSSLSRTDTRRDCGAMVLMTNVQISQGAQRDEF
jgi:hypothetical protein